MGFNISGLVYNQPEKMAAQLGLTTDYRKATEEILRGILTESDLNVLLIPHVLVPLSHGESDTAACAEMYERLHADFGDRVGMGPSNVDSAEAKGIISRCVWFCGTRMHATIAALSTGVPTATIAYSGKAIGVFESIKQGEHVADARRMTTEATVAQILDSFRGRERTREILTNEWATFRQRVDGQMDQIVECCLQVKRQRR